MTASELPTEILKTDSRGRVRTTAARRERLLNEFEKSKLSGQKFAQLTGLKYSTFAVWVQKRRRRRQALPSAGASAKSATVEWLETVIDQAQAAPLPKTSALLIRLPSGAAVELAHLSQVSLAAALLRAWEKTAC